MDTKGIDLTQCINCRFRAVVDGKEVTGRIEKSKRGFLLTGDEWFGCVITYLELATLRGGTDLITDDGNFRISGFEIVPRDPETYRDWQVGDVIWDTHESGDNGKVIFRNGEFVAAEIIGMCRCYTCQELFKDGYRLVLTDIEQQIIEERKKAEWKPQDGDICFVRTSAGNCFIFIKKDSEVEEEIYNYASFDTNGHYLFLTKVTCVCCKKDIRELRPATDEEKRMLFDAMAKEGKRWNAEKKVVEDIPKPYEFKKGEPVLVRDVPEGKWLLSAFVRYNQIDYRPFCASNGTDPIHFLYCLPYNEKTMHLLGTGEDYKEE